MNSTIQTTRSVSDPYNSDEIMEAVVSTVADAEGTSPVELRPLTTAIDPDALCSLYRGGSDAVTVEFHYHGYRVCVSGDDHVTVEVSSD